MKKQITTFALSAFVSAGLLAATPLPQDQAAPNDGSQTAARNQHHPMDPNRQVKMMTKRLALSGDQQTQIVAILKDRQQRIASLTSDNSMSDKDRHAALKAAHTESAAKIRATLNENQQQEYDQMQQQARERARSRHETETPANGSPTPNSATPNQ